MSIPLAFSTNAFTGFPLAEALRRIAGHGYKAVEILADVPHAYPPTTGDADHVATVRREYHAEACSLELV